MNMILMYMIHHKGPSGLKKSFKLLGNQKAIPMILGTLDHKLWHASFAIDSALAEKCYMLIGFDP